MLSYRVVWITLACDALPIIVTWHGQFCAWVGRPRRAVEVGTTPAVAASDFQLFRPQVLTGQGVTKILYRNHPQCGDYKGIRRGRRDFDSRSFRDVVNAAMMLFGIREYRTAGRAIAAGFLAG